MTLIRPATGHDAPGILEIMNPIIAETTITFSPDLLTKAEVIAAIQSHLDEDAPYLVAVEGEHVLGFAKYGPFRGGAGYRRTVELTVHLAPTARGRGLGRALLERLEGHARNEEKQSLIAGISAENDTALGFHAHMGFAETGRISRAGHKFGRYIDLVFMQKFL